VIPPLPVAGGHLSELTDTAIHSYPGYKSLYPTFADPSDPPHSQLTSPLPACPTFPVPEPAPGMMTVSHYTHLSLLFVIKLESGLSGYEKPLNTTPQVLYTNKLYSKILHPVTDEVTMLQTSTTRRYTLSRSSNTRSYIILRASNTQSYITLRASNTQGYIILRTSNTRSYTCHGRVTYEVTNFHRRITHDHTRVTQKVHRYYY
jgi:hypothetical protein